MASNDLATAAPDPWRGCKLTIGKVYNGHSLHAVAWYLCKTHEWEPRVTISWTEEGIKKSRRFRIDLRFPTQTDANRAGLQLSEKWIDEAKPESSALLGL